MKEELKKIINEQIHSALNRAEFNWKNQGKYLIKGARACTESFSEDSLPSRIPKHPSVSGNSVEVDDFIALVADMRDSTSHMLTARAEKRCGFKVQQLERIYYETTALLPALNETISYHGGSVTEYLGDGVLALFKYEGTKTVYAAHDAAFDIICGMKDILNTELYSRYCLENISLGVGMAYSKCFVTQVGSSDNKQAKVFGQNVFRATKLSIGRDIIYIDEDLKAIWPTAVNGRISFASSTINDINAYKIEI